MIAIQNARRAAALIILLGCAVAGAAALVPFHHVGYVVDALALAAVLTPFVLYGMFVTSLRGPWLLASGLALLGVSLAVVAASRFLDYDGYRDATVYWVPLLATAIVLPLACAFGRRPPYD